MTALALLEGKSERKVWHCGGCMSATNGNNLHQLGDATFFDLASFCILHFSCCAHLPYGFVGGLLPDLLPNDFETVHRRFRKLFVASPRV